MKNKLKYMFTFGCIFTLLPIFTEYLYYNYAPISWFIKYDIIKEDIKQSDDEQLIFLVRDSKYPVRADFYSKTFCGEELEYFKQEWYFKKLGVFIPQTEGEEKIDFPLNVLGHNYPVGKCSTTTSIDIHLNGYTRALPQIKSEFQVTD